MVNPVSSAIAQQIPAANTFQPGRTNESPKVKELDERLETAQTKDTSSTRASDVNTKNSEPTRSFSSAQSTEDTGRSASSSRGSTVDISV